MKKNIKKESIKVREPLKKATRENGNIEERLDEVTGGGRAGVGGSDESWFKRIFK